MDQFYYHDRLKGLFWGLVVGDCLGSPIQFSDMDDHPYITRMEPCEIFNTPPGYWTDDASMAFCIAESFLRCGSYNLVDIAKNFIRWYEEGFCSSLPYSFDVGMTTVNSIKMLKRGSLCNGSENQQGNGSIMRFAPSYIMNLKYPNHTLLYEISNLTHDSSVVRSVIDRMKMICDTHLTGCRTTEQSEYTKRTEVNNSGWVVSTLEAALWAFHSTESFEDGLIAAVNLGGDSDTIGAVFGQIAGAYYGYEAIPEYWLQDIKDRHQVNKLIDDFITSATRPVSIS